MYLPQQGGQSLGGFFDVVGKVLGIGAKAVEVVKTGGQVTYTPGQGTRVVVGPQPSWPQQAATTAGSFLSSPAGMLTMGALGIVLVTALSRRRR